MNIDKLPPSWKKVHRALMQMKEEITMVQLGAHLYVEEGIRQKESKNKGGARDTRASGKGKAYVKCWVCNGPHFKKDCEVWKKRKAQMEGKSSGDHGQTNDSWWVDTGATRHVCKDINLYKVYKSLENGPSLFEPHKAHRHIILCIQRMFTEPIRSFKYAPQHLKDVWFNEFKKKHRWDPSEEDTVRRIFQKKGAKLLLDHLREAREGFAKNRAKPDWISDDVMAGLVRIWGSDEFKKLSEKNKRNKNSDCHGLGASLHSCGSFSMTEHRRRLKEKLGEDPSHAALYEHTHKRKNGNGAYVCRKAQKVVDVANDLRQSQPDASNAQLWLEAIGAESSSNATLLAEIQQMREENKMFREENKMFREENKMFREEVVKMGAILTQLSPNSEWLASLNINNSTSTNDETQAPNDED
nr:uncharacterized protein LOC109185045 [Ipomoea trifida]